MLRNSLVIALLLPGLAMAAPTAGPCGRCGDDVPCPMNEIRGLRSYAHSCCGETSEPVEAALGSSDCQCGREAPPAVAASAPAAPEDGSAEDPRPLASDPVTTEAVAVRGSDVEPPPRPVPRIFLVDCAFLT
jgi:hypothetical protein